MKKILSTLLDLVSAKFLSGYRTRIISVAQIAGGIALAVDGNSEAGAAAILTGIGLWTARTGSKNDMSKLSRESDSRNS